MSARWVDISVFDSDYDEEMDSSISPPRYRHRPISRRDPRIEQFGRVSSVVDWMPGRRPDLKPKE